jgi:hypothetical protein
MTGLPSGAELVTYLDGSGWRRQPRSWRGASVWVHPGDHEVLVPADDSFGDSDRRKRDVLSVLAAVEGRTIGEVALDVLAVLRDVQDYRLTVAPLAPAAVTPADDSGQSPASALSVDGALRFLEGVRSLLRTAARSAAEGPHFTFGEQPDPGTRERMRQLTAWAQLWVHHPGMDLVTVRTPVLVPDGEPVVGPPAAQDAAQAAGKAGRGWPRTASVHLYEAVRSAQEAVQDVAAGHGVDVFDAAVAAGVSAQLCDSLARLLGPVGGGDVALDFRWGRGRPAHPPPARLVFPTGSAQVLRAATRRLQRGSTDAAASVRGQVQDLHDDVDGRDRWRVRVRGALAVAGRAAVHRSVWVRLESQPAYDEAIHAHRDNRAVVVDGVLLNVRGRMEIVTASPGLRLLDNDDTAGDALARDQDDRPSGE